MKHNRTFLLGAGFSKSVAEAPLMNEIWPMMEDVYKKELKKEIDTNRIEWFEKLEEFINNLEGIAKNNLQFIDDVEVSGGIKDNLEYLYTLIDLHTNGSALFKFRKENADMDPYPVIPFRFTSRDHMEEIRRILSTYLYIVFVDMELKNNLLRDFSLMINEDDNFITFNYDLLLEKSLWNKGLWSPLEGYVGVNEFVRKNDYSMLKKNNKHSLMKIHKMHGSISWEYSFDKKNIKLNLDDKENSKFYYQGIERFLNRNSLDFSEYGGYSGKYGPPWIFPSFIKPFDVSQMFKIWESAFNVLKGTEELIIIGYSFRPEDTNGQLLLANLPQECKIILVDPYPDIIRERLNNLDKKVDIHYNSIKELLSNYQGNNFI